MIEPSLGCDRVALAFLCEAYDEEHLVDAKGKEDVRTVLHLHPFLAPFKCAVLPLSKKLSDKAMEIRNELAKDFMVDFDEAGSIGKRYRRQDEIGTPMCITVDFDTVGDPEKGKEADNCVTVRRPRHDGAGADAHCRTARLHCEEGRVLIRPDTTADKKGRAAA